MELENQTPKWERTPFTFSGTELQLIEVVERYIHALSGTRKIDFHLSCAEQLIHIRQTAAWLEEQDFDLVYDDLQMVEKTKFVRAVWIGKGEKEYLNESIQAGLLTISYRYMAVTQPLPLPDFLPRETHEAFQYASIGLAVKVSKQTQEMLHGVVEYVPLMRKAAEGIIESIQQWNKQVQMVTSVPIEKGLPIYSGYWGTEPIVINRWTTIVDMDIDSFDYRFGEGLADIFNSYSRANQCHPDRRKITNAKIIYISLEASRDSVLYHSSQTYKGNSQSSD